MDKCSPTWNPKLIFRAHAALCIIYFISCVRTSDVRGWMTLYAWETVVEKGVGQSLRVCVRLWFL